MSNAPDPRQVEYVPLSSLQADPRNPKAHDQETIDASIGRFGVLDLIVRDERTGYIVSGHGRRKALTNMARRGESAPEGVRVDEATGEWLVPVVTGWASRTDNEAGAALIALNRTTELGGWVDEELLGLLEELDEVEDGFEGVGFGEADLDDLRVMIEEGDFNFSVGASAFDDEVADAAPRNLVLTMPTAAFVWVMEVFERMKAETQGSNTLALVRVVESGSGERLPGRLAEMLETGNEKLGVETFEAGEEA